ncbi:hypothetical protein BBJ28_00025585 [Nothophytophthora sp. Chile5]|nr:hypothetical protein BBJ28_00025585 [Nothophytophthora sp. Chile5]
MKGAVGWHAEMASTAVDEDDSAPLDLLEFTPLPPLSPAMQRAFCEAFGDEPEAERAVEHEQTRPKAVDLEERRWQDDHTDGCSDDAWSSPAPSSVGADTRISASSSPCPADMASAAHNQERRQDELMNMSPGETKKSAECADPGEAKRARRSAIEKKSRQRRQGVLRRMRDEVKQLENEYAAMAQKKDAAISGYGDGDRYAPYDHSVTPGLARRLYNQRASSVDDLQHKYSQLSLVTHALEEDRATLLKLLQSHEFFQQTTRSVTNRSDGHRNASKIQDNQDDRDQEDDLIWDTGVPHSSSFTAEMRQFSPVECYEIVRETYETIQRFDDGGHFVSTGANFMGWTDKRKYDQSRALQYGFAKNFPLESAEGLLMRTWDVFCHGDSMAHLSFDASVCTRFQILQQLGDDLYIIRRDHKFPSMPMNFLTVHVVFRLQTTTGYTLCMRTIPAPDIKNAVEPHEYFYDVFHWTHFNQLYDENGRPAGCEITTGGYIADVKQLISKYWLFELIVSVLRWENMCVAPLFLKNM